MNLKCRFLLIIVTGGCTYHYRVFIICWANVMAKALACESPENDECNKMKCNRAIDSSFLPSEC